MSGFLLAEFPGADALLRAARQGRRSGMGLVDAFSPYPVDGLADEIGETSTTLRVAMFIGGVGVAALSYFLEWYSAVIDYPINSGGRPPHSWPAFVMFPVAFGILAAAIAGLVALMFTSGLPRLHYPLFALDRFSRVSQDGFMLVIAAPAREDERQRSRAFLQDSGATAIWEIER